jgi:hypothetical protein
MARRRHNRNLKKFYHLALQRKRMALSAYTRCTFIAMGISIAMQQTAPRERSSHSLLQCKMRNADDWSAMRIARLNVSRTAMRAHVEDATVSFGSN